MDVPPIRSERLELVSMSPAFLELVLGGARDEAARALGVPLPEAWPGDGESTLRRRRHQMAADEGTQPWLLRAIVRREPEPEMVGHINFHGPPDAEGIAEIGYSVLPAHRRRGYATEAVRAMLDWATREHGVHRFRASVSPENAPSLAVVRRLGFTRTGEQWDEEDGLELVFDLAGWRG
jgi:RimJ/RimL family protein N-acetyltransferase